jgi:hypothetical protein
MMLADNGIDTPLSSVFGVARGKFLMLIFILTGLGMAILGVTALTDDTPKCSGHTMKSNDTCIEVNRSTGHTTTRNVDEQRHSGDSTGWWLLGFGIPMTVLGVLGMVNLVRMQSGQPLLGESPPTVT